MLAGSKGREKKEKEKKEKEKKEKERREKEKKQVQLMEVNSGSEESEAEEYIEEEGGIKIGDIYIPPAPPAVCSVESKGPRLIITHIENENFKSYAGRRVLGPFHKSFTSIVGPNGSGKSNVIDSMLFVFGYRASKIRSKKISVLIHKSDKHRNIRSCSVAVHFVQINDLPNGECEVIQNSKIVIARTAFSDNSSYYTLNGKRVQFKDVSTVLRNHGIDLVHNRFLILQGEVEQIAMMKPKAQTEHETGMLEYLEDIVGTSRFKVPIEKLGAKVEALNAERTEKLNRVKLVEKERDNLEGPMQEAIQFLEKENELTEIRNVLQQKHVYDMEKELESFIKNKEKMEENVSEMKEQLKNTLSEQVAKQKEIEKLEKELSALLLQKDKASETFNKIQSVDANLGEELTQTNMKRNKAKETRKQEEEKLKKAEAVPEKNKSSIEELVVLKTKLDAECEKKQEELNTAIKSSREETDELQQKKEKLQNKLSSLKNKVDDARSKHDLAKREIEIYLSTEQGEKKKLEDLKTKLQSQCDTLKTKSENLKSLSAKLPAAEEELNSAQSELVDVKTKESSASEQLSILRSSLEEKRSSMSANRSRNRTLDFLYKMKEDGKLPGIYGRLGDLGAIDAKYDVAVSTACGPLDNIVVDTVETGKDCVAALKQYNIGRATFIALDKQEHLRPVYSKPMKTPENVPRLFDLIKVSDDRVRPAFYYALRDTLVADELNQATRIAYGKVRHRVVTLHGEIIEPSGTMSGGGNTVLRGRMGRSVAIVTDTLSPGQMSRMEKQVTELESRVKSLRERAATLEGIIETRSKEVKAWKMEIQHLKIDVEALSKQDVKLKEQMKDQERKVKEVAVDQNTVKKMNSVTTTAKKELEEAESAAGEVESEVNTVNEEILKITQGRTTALRKKLDEATKKADKVSAEITKLKVGIKTAERNMKNARNAIETLTKEIEQAETRITEIKEEREEKSKQGKESLAVFEKLLMEVKEKENEVDEIRGELAKASKKENEIKGSKIEEERKVKEMEGTIKGKKNLISSCKQKINALSLNKIPKKNNSLELKTLTEEELAELDKSPLMFLDSKLQEELNNMSPNQKVIDEYQEKVQLYIQRAKELDDITNKRNEYRQWHDNVRKSRLHEFMTGFNIITSKLKEMYQMITLGGDAELELVDTLDPFAEGIIFSVRPPKKSWKNISNLSGGEKTLSSLALVFALHYYKPTPLYVMDEIDAALDFKNVSIVGHYIKERTKNAQFIIISLRANMFELADTLVGIYKVNNCTQTITITPSKYALCRRVNDRQLPNNQNKESMQHVAPTKREGSKENQPPKKVPRRSPLKIISP